MSSTRPFIDPEVALLLRETIRDPEAELFKAKDPSTLAGVSALAGRVSVRQAGLALAERHLLQTYREEAAWLLRQAALTRLYEEPGNAHVLEKSVTVDRDIELIHEPEWTRRAAVTRARGTLDDVPEACWEWSGQVSIETLCEASCRLLPSDEALIYLAFNANRGGRYELVAPLLKRVLEAGPTALNASYAWENLGYLYSNLRQLDRAVDAYRLGASTCERRPAAVLQWLHIAVRASNGHELTRAAAFLDDMIAPDHSALDAHISNRAALLTSVTDPVRATVADARARFGPTSRRATDVYFGS
ncbi:MAG: tetratricopeptide (TPR) repeat protein [Chlamydiales bacterium]|jgi:tetratricopeptide (TPR) repeat protein